MSGFCFRVLYKALIPIFSAIFFAEKFLSILHFFSFSPKVWFRRVARSN